MEEKMRHLKQAIFILLVVTFLIAPYAILNGAEEVTKTEKTVKHCCPACKKEMDKDAAKFKVDYKDKTYYFCCEECKAKFEKDPEKYLKNCEDAKKCSEDKVYYVCPMKQCNYKTDKPGKCPKCGMELKKVSVHPHCCHEKHKKEDHEHAHGDEHQHNHK